MVLVPFVSRITGILSNTIVEQGAIPAIKHLGSVALGVFVTRIILPKELSHSFSRWAQLKKYNVEPNAPLDAAQQQNLLRILSYNSNSGAFKGALKKQVWFKFEDTWFLFTRWSISFKESDSGRNDYTYFIMTLSRDTQKLKRMLIAFENESIHYEIRGVYRPTLAGRYETRDVFSWQYKETVPVKLDDIPIHSDVRKELVEQIDWLNSKWNSTDLDATKATRGLLLYGPPGGGKTTIARALSMEVQSRFYMCPAIKSSDSFWTLIEETRVRRTILFDDADANPCFWTRDALKEYQAKHASAETTSRSRSSASSLIMDCSLDDINTVLSGPLSPPSTLFVITTNKPWDIDPSIYREGRIKKKVFVDLVDDAGIKYWLTHRYNIDCSQYTFPSRRTNQIFSLEENSRGCIDTFINLLLETPPAVEGSEAFEDFK